MSSESGSAVKWLLGILATVVSSVIVYYLTEAWRPNPLPVVPPISFNSTPLPSPSNIIVVAPSPEDVEMTITNTLGPEQVSEDVQVYIEGKLVANLMVDQKRPNASVKIKVARPGNYAYTLSGDAVFVNQLGQMYQAQGRGEGVVEVREGSVFTLVITPHGLRMIPE
jgi:hypothetical protein